MNFLRNKFGSLHQISRLHNKNAGFNFKKKFGTKLQLFVKVFCIEIIVILQVGTTLKNTATAKTRL